MAHMRYAIHPDGSREGARSLYDAWERAYAAYDRAGVPWRWDHVYDGRDFHGVPGAVEGVVALS